MKPANLPCVYLQPSLLYLLYVLLSCVKTVNIQMKITRFLTEAVSWKPKTFLIVKIWYVLGFEQKFSGFPIASQFVNYFWIILLFRVITGYLWDCFMPILCFFHYQRKVGMARLLLLFDIVKKNILETPVLNFHRFIQRRNLSDLDNGTHWSKMIFLITSR